MVVVVWWVRCHGTCANEDHGGGAAWHGAPRFCCRGGQHRRVGLRRALCCGRGRAGWSGLSPGTQSAIRLDARAQRCSHTETHDPSWTTAGARQRQTQLQLRCCLCADDTNTNMTFGSDDTRGSQGDYTTLSWAEARPRQYSGVGAPPARDHIASLTAGGYTSQSPPRVWRRSAGCNGGPHPPACANGEF